MGSWRSKTNANYNLAWKRWERWCQRRSLCAFSANIQSILEFLATEFQEGKQYCSLNCYRSANSSVHMRIEGVLVGNTP